jgi:hypothetical protein
MATRIYFAIMGVTQKDHVGINELGQKVLDTIFVHADVYADVPITQAILKSKVDVSVAAQAHVKKGGTAAKIARDTASKDLHDTLENLILPYVNGLWKGNQQNLVLSGFSVSKDPAPVDPPAIPVIKKIVDGTEPGTVKIILEKSTGPLNKKKQSLMYFVYQTKNPLDETTLQLVLTTSNSHQLIVQNVQKDVPVYYCVSARYRKMGSELSGKVKHTLN